MKIESGKQYKVTKFGKTDSNLGILSGEDVKKLLKGYEFDEMFGMWYSSKATIGYDVKEVK